MNIKFVFGRQNDHICNKIGKRNGKYVTEVSFLSPINEFYPIERRACHYSNISLFSCWVKLYGHRTQNDTSVTNQGISILKFQACFNLRPMQPMISRVIAKSGWRGQMWDCTNQMQTHFPSMDMYEDLGGVSIAKLFNGATQRSYL